MSAKVREIKDNDGTIVYPVTRASSVYMPGGTDTVSRVLGDMIDQDTDYTFSGNKIIKTMASGNTTTTEFNDDGSITETTKDADDHVLQVKEYTFEDGEIHIVIDGEDDDEEE